MSRIFCGCFAVALGLGLCPSAVATEDSGQERPSSPMGRYQSLLREQELASSPGRVLSDGERLQFIGQTFRRWNGIALEFVRLAEEHPKDPIAVDALIRAVWQVNSTPWPIGLVGPDDGRIKAFALLRRDHLGSASVGPLCQRISSGFCEEYETFLRAVLEKSPHDTVRAQACLALAHYLSNRSMRLDLIRERPELGEEFAGLFGKEYLARLRRQGREEDIRQAEALFERAARDYADVALSGGKVAQLAGAELDEIRHLTPGKRAPEIEGMDQDGRRFKLGDYRGKVVLLDFWSEY